MPDIKTIADKADIIIKLCQGTGLKQVHAL